MKFGFSAVSALTALFLAGGPEVAEAVKCGKFYSSTCLARSDIRYDKGYTNDIVAQEPRWGKLRGYWRTRLLAFDANFKPVSPTVFNPVDLRKARGLPYERSNYTTYVNYTFDGSRVFSSTFQILGPAPEWFCNQNKSGLGSGDLLVLKNGTCGETGYASYNQIFLTSSHEKDGTLELVGGLRSALALSGFTDISSGTGGISGDNVINFKQDFTVGNGINSGTQSITFTNKEGTKAASTVDTWNISPEEAILIGTRRSIYEKITEEEFISGIQQDWDDIQAPISGRPSVPATKECLSEVCQTEADWCKHDPNCSISPYQEPEAKLNGGVVGGVVAACAVIIILALYAYHRWCLAKDAAKIRLQVAARISKQLQIDFGSDELTPDALKKQFENWDKSGDGVLQKEEVKAFFTADPSKSMRNLDTGGDSAISEAAFEAIFAALDNDGDGEVDFVEFVTFMNLCKKELGDTAK